MREPEGEFSFADAHFVTRHRGRAAIGNDLLGEDAPREWPADIDVLLPGRACRGDFPAE